MLRLPCARLFFQLAAAGTSLPLLAQPDSFVSRLIGVEEGLPEHNISCIYQDSRSLLWIGTNAGLYTFDGLQFQPAMDRPPHPLPDREITDLEEIQGVSERFLLVCTATGSRLIDPYDQLSKPAGNLGIQDSLLHRCIQIEPSGKNYIALLGQELWRFVRLPDRRFKPEFICRLDALEKPFLFIQPGETETIWVLSRARYVYRLRRGNLTRYDHFWPPGKNNTYHYSLAYLTHTAKGLIGWNLGQTLILFNTAQDSFVPDSSKHAFANYFPGLRNRLPEFAFIRARAKLRDNTEVFATSVGLLFVRHIEPPPIRRVKGLDQEIRGILTDSSGRWWAGTYQGIYSGVQGDKKPPVRALPHSAAWDYLHLAKSNEWLVGLESRNKILHWNTKTNKVGTPLRYNPEFDAAAGALVLKRDFKGLVWAGTYYGLYWSMPDSPYVFHAFRDPNTGKPLQAPFIRAILPDRDSSLWVGSESGLFRLRFNPALNQYEQIATLPELVNVNVSFFFPDRHGHIWIGTKGKGLARYSRKTKQLEWLDADSGLCHNSVCRLESSHNGNVLWISTHKGLTRLDLASGITQHYYAEDGFVNNEFNSAASAKAPDGTLYFGGVSDLIYFHPDSMPTETGYCSTLITYYEILDEGAPAPVTRPLGNLPLHLRPYPRLLEFLLGSSDLLFAEKIRFRYRLLGVSDQWSITKGEHSVRFFNLPPGHYVFEAQAIPYRGRLGPPARIQFTVAKPWHETWQFRILILLLITGSGFAAYQYRLRQLRKEQIIRQKIADDLHDDIGNKLNLIGIFAQKIIQFQEQKRLENAQITLEKLAAVSRETLRTFHHMLWSIDPQKDSLSDMITRMRDFTDDFLLPLSIPCDFDIPNAMLSGELQQHVRYHVIHIYQELLTNIVKHTQAVRLSVIIRLKGKAKLEITIINQHRLNASPEFHSESTRRGQASLERRLRQINGQIIRLKYLPGHQKTVLLVPNIFKEF